MRNPASPAISSTDRRLFVCLRCAGRYEALTALPPRPLSRALARQLWRAASYGQARRCQAPLCAELRAMVPEERATMAVRRPAAGLLCAQRCARPAAAAAARSQLLVAGSGPVPGASFGATRVFLFCEWMLAIARVPSATAVVVCQLAPSFTSQCIPLSPPNLELQRIRPRANSRFPTSSTPPFWSRKTRFRAPLRARGLGHCVFSLSLRERAPGSQSGACTQSSGR